MSARTLHSSIPIAISLLLLLFIQGCGGGDNGSSPTGYNNEGGPGSYDGPPLSLLYDSFSNAREDWKLLSWNIIDDTAQAYSGRYCIGFDYTNDIPEVGGHFGTAIINQEFDLYIFSSGTLNFWLKTATDSLVEGNTLRAFIQVDHLHTEFIWEETITNMDWHEISIDISHYCSSYRNLRIAIMWTNAVYGTTISGMIDVVNVRVE